MADLTLDEFNQLKNDWKTRKVKKEDEVLDKEDSLVKEASSGN